MMMDYFFASNRLQDANPLVVEYHYSHRPPANVQFCATLHESGGLFGDLGECVAACYFSIPPTRWSEPVLELSRLVRRDNLNYPLTKLIAFCCYHLKKMDWDLLVSFADHGEGHHGGIYQASSWNYNGKRDSRMDGLIINGKFVPGRTANSLWGTRSPQRLSTLKPELEIQAHFDVGKHLYWKALSKIGKEKAKRLGLRCLPYCKPSKD